MTPLGRYFFTVYPMGLSISSDVFQHELSEMIKSNPELTNVVLEIDDVLIFGDSFEKMLQQLRLFLKLCRKRNITLSPKKVQYADENELLDFAGYAIGFRGCWQDNKKLDALKHFPRPVDKNQLRSFLGLTAGMAFWFPDMSIMVNSLRLMTHKNQPFDWKDHHTEEFNKAKEEMCSPVFVRPFDINLESHMFVDTSKIFGVGFILLQKEKNGDWRLIRCASSCAKKY